MKGNRISIWLPIEIISVHKKSSAVFNQFEESHILYILALHYKEEITKDFGAKRAEELIEKYKNMTFQVSTELKKQKEEARKRAEEKGEIRDQALIDAGKRAEERIQQRNRMLELQENKQKSKRETGLEEKRILEEKEKEKRLLAELRPFDQKQWPYFKNKGMSIEDYVKRCKDFEEQLKKNKQETENP